MSSLQSRRLERDSWKAAYSDLRAEFITSNEQQSARLDKLAKQLNKVESEFSRSRGNAILWLVAGATVGLVVGR